MKLITEFMLELFSFALWQAIVATGTNLQLVFGPGTWGFNSDASRDCDFDKEPGKVKQNQTKPKMTRDNSIVASEIPLKDQRQLQLTCWIYGLDLLSGGTSWLTPLLL